MEVSSTATDVALEEAQMMENQIDTAGQGFPGLTIACARCHDHKFDAISTRDYYGIFGALASSRQSQTVDRYAGGSPDWCRRASAVEGRDQKRIGKGLEDLESQSVSLNAISQGAQRRIGRPAPCGLNC